MFVVCLMRKILNEYCNKHLFILDTKNNEISLTILIKIIRINIIINLMSFSKIRSFTTS